MPFFSRAPGGRLDRRRSPLFAYCERGAQSPSTLAMLAVAAVWLTLALAAALIGRAAHSEISRPGPPPVELSHRL